MDVQTTDHKSMILRYVTSYVTKFKDSQILESLYSRHVTSAMAAYRHLGELTPLAPEMVVTLTSSKPAWTNNATKRYVPPRPDNAQDSALVTKYVERGDVASHLSLIEWMRTYDTNKTRPTPYKRQVALVGVKYVSVLNPDYFFQYLLVNHPFTNLEQLRHPDHEKLPEDLTSFAAALVLQPELWSNDDSVRTLFSQQGHKNYYVENLVNVVDSLRQLYHLWQVEVLTNNDFQTDYSRTTFHLNKEQDMVLRKLQSYLALRNRHYTSLRALRFEQTPSPLNFGNEEEESDSELIHDDPQQQRQRPMPNVVEQTYHETDRLNDWTKIISIVGSPGTGKTQCSPWAKWLKMADRFYFTKESFALDDI